MGKKVKRIIKYYDKCYSRKLDASSILIIGNMYNILMNYLVSPKISQKRA